MLLSYLFKFSKTSDLLSNSWNIWFLLSIADSLYNFVIYYNELWIPDYDKKSNTLGPSEFLFWYQWYRWYWHRYFFIDLTSSRYFLVIILMIMVIILVIRKMLIMTIMMSKWWSWQWPALPEVASLPVCHPLSHFPRLEKHHHNHHHNHHHRHRHRHSNQYVQILILLLTWWLGLASSLVLATSRSSRSHDRKILSFPSSVFSHWSIQAVEPT